MLARFEAAAFDEVLDAVDLDAAAADSALLGARARSLVFTGRLDEAIAELRDVIDEHDTPAARAVLGELLLRRAEAAEAVAVLDPAVEGAVPDLEARYWRAEAFARSGRSSRSDLEMQDFIRAYNRGQTRSGHELMLVGMACRALGLYSDANDAFRQALELDNDSVEIRWRWSEIFLEKYRPDEALRLLDEALAIAPTHPMVLTLRARAAIDAEYDLLGAIGFLERALRVAPEFPEALELQAEMRIDNQDLEGAIALLDRVEAQIPGRLESLTLRGAALWLADDEAAYADVERRVLQIAPMYARFYHVVGDFGVRNFRYVEAVELFRTALDTNANYWPAYVSLGIGYSRVGEDDRAVSFLRRAFDHDPFNEMAFNMVELFEQVLPRYRVVADAEINGLQYRFHEREADVLTRYVPDVIRRAWHDYSARYSLVPELPISVEVLADQATFGIRSVGLPYAQQHGICFGHLVTSRSPADGNFNWRMVIEHELSHVFSLNASRYRVPRWFTEGLAEYDTILTDDTWRREEEVAIASTLRRNDYIGVLELNDAFVDRSFGRILAAYFQASLLVEFIGEQWSYQHLVDMLHAWGRSLRTPQVIEEVLGVDVAELDRRFEAHLRARVAGLLGAWEPDLDAYTDLDGLRAASEASPGDAGARAAYAVALLGSGDVESARTEIERALAVDARQPLALFVAGTLAAANGDVDVARASWSDLVESGHDGATVREALAQVALSVGDLASADAHIDALQAFYPRSVEAARLRMQVAERRGDAVGLRAASALFGELEQHDPDVALWLARDAAARGVWSEAARWARRAVEIAPFERDVHTVLGQVATEIESWPEAQRELELELAAGPEDRRATLERLRRVYRATGNGTALERVDRELAVD